MAELGDLLIRIDATTEQLRRELKRAETSVDGTAKKIDGSLSKIDGKFAALAKSAAKNGAAMVAALAAAGTAMAAVKITQIGRETDILDAQLKTATGSAEEAARAFSMLEKIAAETPYSLDQVVKAFVRLKNLGLDPSREAIMSYGNTASAMGTSLDQMIEAVADASVGEFERLKEFGIRASKQGDQVTFTFRNVSETVRITGDEITRYLRRIGDVDFAGANVERAASLDGAISNLGDSWDGLFRSIYRGPVGELIESNIRRAGSAVEWLTAKVDKLQGRSTPDQEVADAIRRLQERRDALLPRITNPERSTRGQIVAENARKQVQELNAEIEGLMAVQENLLVMARRRDSIAEVTVNARRRDPMKFEEIKLNLPKKPDLGDAAYDGGLGALERESQRIQDAFAEVDRFFSSTRTETEQLQAQIARVQELSSQGFFAAKGIDDQQILDRLNAQMADIEEKTAVMSEFGLEAARSMQQAFADYLFDPFADGLDGMLDGFMKTIQRMLAEIAAQQVLTGIFAGFAGSTNPLLAGLASFGGPRANGGPVAAGKGYLVGERGPEMFVPSVGGRISPSGGGVAVSIVDQRGAAAPPVDVQRQMVGGMEQIRVMIRSEVGGMFADGTMDRQFRAASMPVRRLGSR